MNYIRLCSITLFFSFPLSLYAQINSYFDKGTHELGLSNLGIGYSSAGGFLVQATTRYQYYVVNRVALGGVGFYNKFNTNEWMGLGPVASYIFLTHENFFSRLDQQLTLGKFNGFDEKISTIYGTSAISVNYLPFESSFSIGAGYAHSYALNSGRVIRPNAFQLFVGWFWQ